jgi:hypothetical protein
VEEPCEKELLETTKPKKPKHRKTKKMSKDPYFPETPSKPCPPDLRLKALIDKDGHPMMRVDELHEFLIAEIAKLPKEVNPVIRAAADARAVMDELTVGIGGEMEKFKIDAKNYLQDIRSTRMSMVSEVSSMTAPLREVRQFFHGADYADEMKRLREFVDLCERLKALKDSGFLDTVADTMIRLAR